MVGAKRRGLPHGHRGRKHRTFDLARCGTATYNPLHAGGEPRQAGDGDRVRGARAGAGARGAGAADHPPRDRRAGLRDAAATSSRRPCKALRDGHTHYCPAPGLPELREACAEHLSRHRGLAIDPARVADRARREAVSLLRGAGHLRPGRRGDLSEPGLPDLRVGDPLGGRDAGAAAAHRGRRLRVHGGGARRAARRRARSS